MESESNGSIVIRFVKAINDHDVNEIVNLMSEDHIFIDGQDHKSVGKKGMKEAWDGYYIIFPDYQIEISDITESESAIGLFGYVNATYKNLTNELNSNFWRIPAAWKVVIKGNKVGLWQVYADNIIVMDIINRNQ